MRIFIVDDSDLIRERIIALLSEIPKVQFVGQADSLIGTLAKIRDVNPDVVILDIRIKDGNGIEILEQLKKDPKAPIVIMLTQYPFPQYRNKCMEAGADYFLDKATEFQLLPEIITKIQKDQFG
ncbi:MAG: response regulator transcription factor [Calditrichia bacterium]|nr:response regulator transcription factor [Calditrichia bacterium]MCK5330203.1 response regulator transcription factor [Candidatus Neomarinimicrobiota bacterium]